VTILAKSQHTDWETHIHPNIHLTADVSPLATIGHGTRIWHHAQIREQARIGDNCIIGKGAYVDFGVTIGSNSKIQNACFLYHGASLGDGVFLGPGVILTNDRVPRAVNPDGSPKTDNDWEVGRIHLHKGASLGAGVVILPDTTIGEFAMVGGGSVVTRDVPDYGLVLGNPARLVGFVCRCGRRLEKGSISDGIVEGLCRHCDSTIPISTEQWTAALETSRSYSQENVRERGAEV
jgi:UDP-2-acetamido-3-amino-2,3-dideoxy-glucuronate N-acetyltransferase